MQADLQSGEQWWQAARRDGLQHCPPLPESLEELKERQIINFFPSFGWYVGRVIDYNTHPVAGFIFRVRYTDDREEDMLWRDLLLKLLPKQPVWKEVEQALSADAQRFPQNVITQSFGSTIDWRISQETSGINIHDAVRFSFPQAPTPIASREIERDDNREDTPEMDAGFVNDLPEQVHLLVPLCLSSERPRACLVVRAAL